MPRSETKASGPPKAPSPPKIVAAVILAGGASRRMGRWKGALEWDDPGAKGRPTRVTLLEAHQRAWKAAGVRNVSVVLAAQYEAEGRSLVEGEAVIQDDPDAPQFASFALGARAALERAPDLSFLAATPVDAPPMRPDALKRMIKIAKKSKALAVRPCALSGEEGDEDDPKLRYGHPVILSRAALDELLALDPAEARLDHWLRDQDPARLRGFAVDDARLLANMNTPEEYEAALRAWREN